MAQHTIQIPITEDTYIDMNNPNTNYGSSTELRAGGGNTNPYYPNYKQEILLKWNESSIPARKKVISKYLCLYAISQLTTQCFLYAVGPSEFSESTATWNNIRSSTRVSYDLLQASNVINAYVKLNILGKFKIWDGKCTLGAEDQQSPTKTLVFASRESSNPPYIEVVYEDVPPSAPTPKDPIGAYKDSKSVIRFAWTYNSDVGGTQKAFDLQWSTDQANWTTVSLTTANNYYDMPADTLPAGNIYWRVRCYNEYDEVGPYCDIQSFYAIGAPAAPVLNAIPANSARPVVSWSAFNQQVYQLQVLSGDTIVYDSGIVPGISIRQHKVKAWLADGEYTVNLRIKNEYDLWSEWGSTSVTISTVKPTKPTVAAAKTSTGIKLTVPVGRMLIYRDGMCIGETSTGEYIDNAVANGKDHEYVVRAIDGYPERQITNLLGEDGDCETLYSATGWQSTGTLDSDNKVYGNYALKVTVITPNASHPLSSVSVAQGKNYFLSGYVKSGTGNEYVRLAIPDIDVYTTGSTDATKFFRIGIKFKSSLTTTANVNAEVLGESGTYGYIDGVMLNEITEDEYDNLGVEQLFAKYPFGNNTFTAPASEVFSDSDPVTATAELKNALIAPVSDLTDIFIFTRSLHAPPKRAYNHQPGGAFVEYAGRTHPVWEPTEHVNAAWQMSFYLKAWAEVEAFVALVDRKETVLYRDAKGRKVYGVLGNLSVTDERGGYSVSFTLTEVDHSEEVEV